MPVQWDKRTARHISRMRRAFVRKHRPGAKSRTKKRQDAIDKLNKRFGAGAVAPIVTTTSLQVSCVSTLQPKMDDWLTGATRLDDDTGKPVVIGGSGRGLPKGRVIEIYGAESCGKTTWCLEMVAAYQSQGLSVAYVDVEHALNLEYCAHLGCDLDEWLLSQPSSGEEACDVIIALAQADIDLIIVDSVAALLPLAEQEKDADEHTISLQARLMSSHLRKLTAILGKHSQSTVVYVNQTREKIMTFGGGGFGPTITTPGGKALKFYASIRIAMQNMGRMKVGTVYTGMRSRLRTAKNKVATPFRDVFVEITFGEGITKVINKLKR